MSEGWSVSQKEAIRANIIKRLEDSEILLALYLEGRPPGKYSTASVDEAIDDIAYIALSELEAITKGTE